MKPIGERSADDSCGFLRQCSLDYEASPDERAFRVAAIGTRQLQTKAFAGGRDVRYVIVSAPQPVTANEKLKATISYGPKVAGTDLIYDVTGEFLQGKARPFECDLTQHSMRVYAVLPFQLEHIVITVPRRAVAGKMLPVRVEFQQATGDRIEGVLPFHLKLLLLDGVASHHSWRSTNHDGRFDDSLRIAADAPRGKWSLVVRSQLSGESATAEIEVAT